MKWIVFYKTPKALFWRKIKNVEGDLLDPEMPGIRVILCADGTRWEIPATCVFRFSKERFLDIQAQMSKEAGQQIKVK
jgi:hypothetical protein